MPKLKVRFLGRRRDAGGVAVLVGILMATGVLLGTAALVVDVGQIYVEREQLQSGADAAAMAVALDCIHNRERDCDDPAAAEATARTYAGLNSGDGVTNVTEVCGQDPRGWMASCTSEPANLTKCINGNPLNTRGWVRVRTSTERNNDSDDSRFILPAIFSRTVVGGSKGTSVGACSRVAWGTPTRAFAFTVCENIYNSFTNFGTDLAPAAPVRPRRSYEHDFVRPSIGSYSGPCDNGRFPPRPFSEGRWTLDSDFGWMTGRGADCMVDLSTAGRLSTRTPDSLASPPSSRCFTALSGSRSNTRPVAVAVLRQTSSTSYRVVGIAAFVVTGYRLGAGRTATSTLTGRLCGSGLSRCVQGYFVGALIPDEHVIFTNRSRFGTFGAAEDLGASVVQTVG